MRVAAVAIAAVMTVAACTSGDEEAIAPPDPGSGEAAAIAAGPSDRETVADGWQSGRSQPEDGGTVAQAASPPTLPNPSAASSPAAEDEVILPPVPPRGSVPVPVDGVPVDPPTDDRCAPRTVAQPHNVVTSPAPGLAVTSGFEVRGCANASEATVHYTLLDGLGQVVASGFATATDGNGTVGSYAFAVTFDPPGVPTPATLRVFSVSDQDGSPLALVEVPLVLGGP